MTRCRHTQKNVSGYILWNIVLFPYLGITLISYKYDTVQKKIKMLTLVWHIDCFLSSLVDHSLFIYMKHFYRLKTPIFYIQTMVTKGFYSF